MRLWLTQFFPNRAIHDWQQLKRQASSIAAGLAEHKTETDNMLILPFTCICHTGKLCKNSEVIFCPHGKRPEAVSGVPGKALK